MTDKLRKAAQDVIAAWNTRDIDDDGRPVISVWNMDKTTRLLREALQAKPEPVAKVVHGLPNNIGWNPETEVNLLPENTPLYTTSPSVDALIAEIEGLHRYNFFNNGMLAFDEVEVEAILDKYRGKP